MEDTQRKRTILKYKGYFLYGVPLVFISVYIAVCVADAKIVIPAKRTLEDKREVFRLMIVC